MFWPWCLLTLLRWDKCDGLSWQKRCRASQSERSYYRLSRSSWIVARELRSLRHHVISLNLVKDGLLLIKDLKESRHDKQEGDAGACPSHLKYKLLDDVVHEKALVDELVEEVVSLILDQFLIFWNTSLLCLLFASHFDSIKQWYQLNIIGILTRSRDPCGSLCLIAPSFRRLPSSWRSSLYIWVSVWTCNISSFGKLKHYNQL